MERCASPQPTTQERLPFDRTALEAFVDRIFEVDGNDAPGAAVLVTREGRVIVQRQSGMASLEHGVPFTPNHVVRLPYSEGREFLAIAAAFMEIDGLTHLDHRVGGYFPRLPAWSEPVWRPARAWAAT